jgi:hypothetical protein
MSARSNEPPRDDLRFAIHTRRDGSGARAGPPHNDHLHLRPRAQNKKGCHDPPNHFLLVFRPEGSGLWSQVRSWMTPG